MFDEYKKEVILAYQESKEMGSLPLDLVNPKPAKLRDECSRVFRERPLKEDEGLLRLFFSLQPNEKEYTQSIKRVDIDKFRPLILFLKNSAENKISQTDDKNIELLAWLIDFQARPYSQWAIDRNKRKTYSPRVVKTTATSINRNFFIAIFLLLILSIASFVLLREKSYKTYTSSNIKEKCMHWVADHYEPVGCEIKNARNPVNNLDTLRLNNLRKINLPDTLTKEDIGRTWYHKVAFDKVEFYTDSGMHPTDTTRRLRPMTAYMLNKYVSYPRYQLNILVKSICIIAFVALIGIMLNRYLPKDLFVKKSLLP